MKRVMTGLRSASEAAEEMQKKAQKMFNRRFEAVVAPGDFAYKINFSRNFVCKVETSGYFALAYGLPYSEVSPF